MRGHASLILIVLIAAFLGCRRSEVKHQNLGSDAPTRFVRTKQKVVLRDGDEPVVGAIVAFYGIEVSAFMRESSARSTANPLYQGRTDQNGAIELEIDHIHRLNFNNILVRASRNERTEGRWIIGFPSHRHGAESNEDIILRTPEKLMKGVVRDSSGHPLSDVIVKSMYDTGKNRFVLLEARTNELGEWSIAQDEDARYLLFSAPGFATIKQKVPRGDTASVDTTLEAGRRIEVRIAEESSSGAILSDLALVASSDDYQSKPFSSAGMAVFDSFSKQSTLWAKRIPNSDVALDMIRYSSGNNLIVSVPTDVSSVELEPYFVGTVTTLLLTDVPPEMIVYSRIRGISQVGGDTPRELVLGGDRSTRRLSVQFDPRQHEQVTVFLTSTEFFRVPIEMRLTPPGDRHFAWRQLLAAVGSVHGMVVDNQGRPVEGAEVICAEAGRSENELTWCAEWWRVNVLPFTTTNKEGEFELKSVGSGSWNVVVRHPSYCAAGRRVDVIAGRRTVIDKVELRRGGSILVRNVPPRLSVTLATAATADKWEGNQALSREAGNGTRRIEGLPSGKFKLLLERIDLDVVQAFASCVVEVDADRRIV